MTWLKSGKMQDTLAVLRTQASGKVDLIRGQGGAGWQGWGGVEKSQSDSHGCG